MPITINQQLELFSLIGRTLKKEIKCFAAGGTAMMFQNIKETTKDVDIIFENKQDYNNFRYALISLGAKEFEKKIVNPQRVSSVLALGEARFDLFLEYIIHFKLTNTIISRIKEVHEFSNLIVKIISPEDIILFKSVADREGNRVDVANILKVTNIKWDTILEEAEAQTKDSELFFSAFLYNFLIGIKEDFNIEIPKDFLSKLEKLTKKALEEAEKRLKKQN